MTSTESVLQLVIHQNMIFTLLFGCSELEPILRFNMNFSLWSCTLEQTLVYSIVLKILCYHQNLRDMGQTNFVPTRHTMCIEYHLL